MNANAPSSATVTAFAGPHRIATGTLREILPVVHSWATRAEAGPLLIFDDLTSQLVEVDLRGTPEEALARLSPPVAPDPDADLAGKRGPGRPKLGVVAREVTLLPRHWDWLNAQPGGASVALRKLVEEARKTHAERDRQREAMEAVHRFLHALAGDLPQFEEVTRALHAGDPMRMSLLMAGWPQGVREHTLRLVARLGN